MKLLFWKCELLFNDTPKRKMDNFDNEILFRRKLPLFFTVVLFFLLAVCHYLVGWFWFFMD